MTSPAPQRPAGRFRLTPAWGCLALIAGLCVFILAVSPLLYFDSDLWIHLSGGKYFMEHHHPPRDSYFSFITPPRPWNSYAWLFQVIVYVLHHWWGPVGLILLRTVLYASTLCLIVRLLSSGREAAQHPRWFAALGILCALVLLSRSMNVRPHMFTYAFIPLLLYVVEAKPERAAWLPVLGLFWCNLHGVTYPVMLLIAGAYSLEYLAYRATGHPRAPSVDRHTFVCLVLMMATVFLTPLGLKLLEAPFRPSAFLSGFILEMKPITWDHLTTFEVTRWVPKARTFFNVGWIAVLLSAVSAICHKRLRISHAVLVLGSVVLLSKGQRFMNEFLLLCLPLLRANPLPLLDQAGLGLPRPVRWALGGLAVSMPLMFAASQLQLRRQYPLSTSGLPEGIGVFLQRLPAGGNVLNWVNSGGYLRWQLYPKYKIYIDMDSYFADEDFYRATRAFTDADLLRALLLEHDPSFISATLVTYVKSFRELIKQFPDYEAVFFDDTEILYINRRHYPELARQYRLQAVDPYEIVAQDVEVTLADESRHERILEELGRLLEIYPDGGNVNSLAGLIRLRQGAYDRALVHAQAIVAHFPEVPQGYVLKARALNGLGRTREALAAYRLAVPRAKPEHQGELVKEMARIHLEQGRSAEAYRLFAQSVDMFAPQISLEDLYAYGTAAFGAGKTSQARAIFSYMAQFRIPDDDAVWTPKVAAALRHLGGEASVK